MFPVAAAHDFPHPSSLNEAHEGRGDQKGVEAVHESLKRFESSNNQSAEAVDGWEGWKQKPHVGGLLKWKDVTN